MRTKSFAAAALLDADGFKTTVATQTSETEYLPVAFNGAAPTGPTHGFAYIPTFSASSSPGSYIAASRVRFYGSYRGRSVIRTAVLTGTGGNQTSVQADGPLEGQPTKIVTDAQTNGSGAFTFGFTDALVDSGSSPEAFMNSEDSARLRNWRKIVGTNTGNLVVGYGDLGADDTDTIPLVAGQAVDSHVQRIVAASTTSNVTVYYG